MVVAVINTDDLRKKFIDILKKANDAKESSIEILLTDRSKEVMIKFFKSQENIKECKVGKEKIIYLVKHIRVELKKIDYHV